MCQASFSVSPNDPKAELTVVQLGPEAAEVLPNLKRWAGQLKLPEVTESDLPKYVKQTQVSGEQGEIVEMTGSPESGNPPTGLLAAIVPHEGATWFFTLKAPQPIVESQKANFEAFVHSVQFVTGRPGPRQMHLNHRLPAIRLKNRPAHPFRTSSRDGRHPPAGRRSRAPMPCA